MAAKITYEANVYISLLAFAVAYRTLVAYQTDVNVNGVLPPINQRSQITREIAIQLFLDIKNKILEFITAHPILLNSLDISGRRVMRLMSYVNVPFAIFTVLLETCARHRTNYQNTLNVQERNNDQEVAPGCLPQGGRRNTVYSNNNWKKNQNHQSKKLISKKTFKVEVVSVPMRQKRKENALTIIRIFQMPRENRSIFFHPPPSTASRLLTSGRSGTPEATQTSETNSAQQPEKPQADKRNPDDKTTDADKRNQDEKTKDPDTDFKAKL